MDSVVYGVLLDGSAKMASVLVQKVFFRAMVSASIKIQTARTVALVGRVVRQVFLVSKGIASSFVAKQPKENN